MTRNLNTLAVIAVATVAASGIGAAVLGASHGSAQGKTEVVAYPAPDSSDATGGAGAFSAVAARPATSSTTRAATARRAAGASDPAPGATGASGPASPPGGASQAPGTPGASPKQTSGPPTTGGTDGAVGSGPPAPPTAPAPSPAAPPPSTAAPSPVGQGTAPAPRPAGQPGAARGPLGNPASYRFRQANPDGLPVRWSPRIAVHYKVSTVGAPPGGLSDLQAAVAKVSAASGSTFVYDGTTNDVPSIGWSKAAAATAPDGWPPVLIGWEHPGQSDIDLSGRSGQTFAQAAPVLGQSGYLAMASGVIAFNLDVPGLAPGFGAYSRGNVMLRQLGYLMGLDSTTDRDQMMFPLIENIPAAYGAGDLAGLARLGTGPTLVVAPRPS